APWGAAADGTTQGTGTPPESSAGGAAEEEALRRLMREVVGDLQPSDRSLDHIRRAVPARRARRRHTLIGATAAVLVAVVSVPALMHTGVMPGPLNDRHANAANSDRADAGRDELNDLPGGAAGEPSGRDAGRSSGAKGKDQEASSSPSEGGTASPGSSDDLASTSPRCTRDQLGDARARVGDPDGQGRVYGSFRLANVSGDTCRVKGSDELVVSALGEADASAIQVLDHTEGGKATGLPSPSTADANLILRPGEAYQVRFAWLPVNAGGGCKADPGPGPAPSPAPEPEPTDPTTGGSQSGGSQTGGSGDGGSETGGGSQTGGGEGGDSDSAGTEGGDETTAGGMQDEEGGMSTLADIATGGGTAGSTATAVVLRYTPAAGAPQAPLAHLKNACAGTVYRTGALRAS
ncbi:hypothetical protein, partial [Streptomyces sparsus]